MLGEGVCQEREERDRREGGEGITWGGSVRSSSHA